MKVIKWLLVVCVLRLFMPLSAVAQCPQQNPDCGNILPTETAIPVIAPYSDWIKGNTTATTTSNFRSAFQGRRITVPCGVAGRFNAIALSPDIRANSASSCPSPLPLTLSLAAGNVLYEDEQGNGGGSVENATPGAVNCNPQLNRPGTPSSLPGVCTDGSNLRMAGPDPIVDITAPRFGARAVTRTLTEGSTNVECKRGSAIVHLDSASFFVNGDGVTLQGCGAPNSMGTPATPTVTPVCASGGTGTHNVVDCATQSSTYSYTVVARDKYGALSKPSAVLGVTSVGAASLGRQIVRISSVSRSNDTVTVNTAEPAGIGAGTLVDIQQVPGNTFEGWFRACRIVSATQFTLCVTPIDSRNQTSSPADQTSASGGLLAYYRGNSIKWNKVSGAWEYYVCAQRPGDKSLHVIGVSKPTDSGTGFQDLQYEDWGPTYHDGQRFPFYVTDSICGAKSATDDPLTTTIASGGGTTILTLAAPAQSDSTKGNIIVLDAAPALLAAANAASNHTGTVYIPPACSSPCNRSFPINSFLQLNTINGLSIKQAGTLALGETIEINGGGVNWDGSWTYGGVPQFAINSGAYIDDAVASPAIHVRGGLNLSYMTINSDGNGSTLIVTDNGGTQFNHVNLVTDSASSTDYLGMAIVYRDATGTIANHKMENGLISGGPNQLNDASWTPLMWAPAGQNGSGGPYQTEFDIQLNYMNFNRRGIELDAFGSGPGLGLDWSYRQGGLTPMVTLVNGGANAIYRFYEVFQDTEAQPLLANLSQNNATPIGNFEFNEVTGGTVVPLISGNRAASLVLSNYWNDTLGATIPPNRSVTENSQTQALVSYPFETSGNYLATREPLRKVSQPQVVVGGYSMSWALLPPTKISVSLAAGGNVPLGTYVYSVSATGLDGGETIPQPVPSGTVTTSQGNRAVRVNWTPTEGAASYNVWRCDTKTTCSVGGVIGGTPYGTSGWFRVGQHVAGASFTDTVASSTDNSPPSFTATGISIVNDQLQSGKYNYCVESAAPAAYPGFAASYCDSATHESYDSNNNGPFYERIHLIARGTLTLPSGTAIASGSCASAITATVKGANPSSDDLSWDPISDWSAINGYGNSRAGVLTVYREITTDSVNFKVCNWTSSAITPGSGARLSYRVTR